MASQGRVMSLLCCGFRVAEFSLKFFPSNSSLIRFSLASKGVEMSSGHRANSFRCWGVDQQERISHCVMPVHEHSSRVKWASSQASFLHFFFFFLRYSFFSDGEMSVEKCFPWSHLLERVNSWPAKFHFISSPQFKATYQPCSLIQIHLYYCPRKTGKLAPSGGLSWERREFAAWEAFLWGGGDLFFFFWKRCF